MVRCLCTLMDDNVQNKTKLNKTCRGKWHSRKHCERKVNMRTGKPDRFSQIVIKVNKINYTWLYCIRMSLSVSVITLGKSSVRVIIPKPFNQYPLKTYTTEGDSLYQLALFPSLHGKEIRSCFAVLPPPSNKIMIVGNWTLMSFNSSSRVLPEEAD